MSATPEIKKKMDPEVMERIKAANEALTEIKKKFQVNLLPFAEFDYTKDSITIKKGLMWVNMKKDEEPNLEKNEKDIK